MAVQDVSGETPIHRAVRLEDSVGLQVLRLMHGQAANGLVQAALVRRRTGQTAEGVASAAGNVGCAGFLAQVTKQREIDQLLEVLGEEAGDETVPRPKGKKGRGGKG